jgi:hypothetical protein
MTTRVVVSIDRLVLRGFRPEDRHAIAEGVRAELARQLERDLAAPAAAEQLARRGDVGRLVADGVPLPPRAPATQVGARVGRAVAGALGGAGDAGDARHA